MARRRLWLLLVAVFARLAACVRLADRSTVFWRTTARERAAPAQGTCGKDAVPLDLARHEGKQGDCDELIPRYDMSQWAQKHGAAVPDHPAVFFNTGTHEAEVFPSMETFLALHGEEEVVALPEYAQSGSHMKEPSAEGKVKASFRELAKVWNDTFVYLSDFKCLRDSLCDKARIQFGSPALFASDKFYSKNFLVGGPDSGLPFHKHGMTWQGLSMGRKAWYVMPPGSMSEELHDETGPYIFPVRAYHSTMVGKRAGQRPLYCVQHPGEVFYVPDYWWHATMNLDRFQVAYGEKPIDKVQQWPRSSALSQMLQVLPQQPWDSAGFTAAGAAGPQSDQAPMPYALLPRTQIMRRTCGRGVDNATLGFEEPLSRMRALAGSQIMRCGLAETAAFAHCFMARTADRVTRDTSCPPDADRALDIKRRAQHWIEEAGKLSPSLVRKERTICRGLKF